MTVHKELDKVVEKYFVSGGFAFVHPDSSADICAVEAVKVSDLDADAVRAGLQVRLLQGPGKEGRVEWACAVAFMRVSCASGLLYLRALAAAVVAVWQALLTGAAAWPGAHCLQEYTNKLAAVVGKGDEYEAAAAQVGPQRSSSRGRGSGRGGMSHGMARQVDGHVAAASQPALACLLPAWCRWASRSTQQ